MARQLSLHPSLGGTRVLLAEDEPAVRKLLARGLRDAGYTVAEACDGDEAARILETSGPFDALCSDMVMPGRSSRQLVEDFAARWPGRPIVMMSGHLVEEDFRGAHGSATVTWLSKPFAVSKLVTALGRGRRAGEGG
jgi:CheY-like chemotaxis protein